jgi:hypothetical protein
MRALHASPHLPPAETVSTTHTLQIFRRPGDTAGGRHLITDSMPLPPHLPPGA